MSEPGWSCPRAIPVPWPPRCAACTTTPRCASASAPPRGRPWPRTPSRPGRPRCRARSPPRPAASVNSPMRRTILLALLATLLCAPAARAADTTTKIWRDCVEDSVLDGHYTLAELREARSHPPADGLEYTDCTDLLARAIAAKTSGSSHSGGDGNGAGAGGGTGAGTGGGTGSGGATGGGGGTGDSAPAAPITPSTPADEQALTQAATQGAQPVKVDGKAVMPGGASLAADVGRNSLPTSLVIVLILLGLAAILGRGRRIRDRVFTHRQP